MRNFSPELSRLRDGGVKSEGVASFILLSIIKYFGIMITKCE